MFLASWARREALNGLWFAADIANMKYIHGAFVRGSVPTAQQESDDILNQPFSDEVREWGDSALLTHAGCGYRGEATGVRWGAWGEGNLM